MRDASFLAGHDLLDWWLAHTFPLGLVYAADAPFLAGHLLLACTMSLERTL